MTFDIALMAGLVIAAPAIMYQVWLFIMPALYANEKKFVIPFVVLSDWECHRCRIRALRAVPRDDDVLCELHDCGFEVHAAR